LPQGFHDTDLLDSFREFCLVDLQLAKKTAKDALYFIREFTKIMAIDPRQATDDDVRQYLVSLNGMSTSTYVHALSAFKHFFRDFLRKGEVVESFRFPPRPLVLKHIPTREQLQEFYDALEDDRSKAIFLFFATTGLRRGEVLSLRQEDIDFNKRMVIPNKNQTRIKLTWVTFFNEECNRALRAYLSSRKPNGSKLFPIRNQSFLAMWKHGYESTGVRMTPQTLRQWFSCEMARLGAPDRYVDAFCGRVPRGVLARHYTDYSPETLKVIYDKAQLKVLF